VTSRPRLLTIMGSGETAPTMAKVHRQLLARVSPTGQPAGANAVLLDTPFGFQVNATDICERAVEYFRESVGAPIDIASFRSVAEVGPVAAESMLNQLRKADYVFAGPGSPSYALRQWAGSQIPTLLRSKLETGGAVTFASAAALTLGLFTVPVYEIYKVGEDPRWLEGLDIISAAGLRAVVIPHYDNAEGGHHDTRFCYLGEHRLQKLELELPDDVFVLGVDEHTGCILDLDVGTATVVGLGTVTVRKNGCSTQLPSGTEVPIAHLTELADQPGRPAPAVVSGTAAREEVVEGSTTKSPLLTVIAEKEASFDEAVSSGDTKAAVLAILELDDELVSWSRDTLQSDELDQGRAAVRGMIVRLGDVAEVGARDPRDVVGPFVEALLSVRADARADKRFADADNVRDRIIDLGIEVRDTPKGTEWDLQ
jgi:cyanophycinase-like exopeptidase